MQIAEEEVRDSLAFLPPQLKDMARPLPVIFEPVPPPDSPGGAIDSTLLGLFTGDSLAEAEGLSSAPSPTQIFLYLNNIWHYARGRPRLYRREIRRTYLHELGHYFGYDENDLYKRGLE